MWINTEVRFEWDGEKYVEVYADGYEYDGPLAKCDEWEYEDPGDPDPQKPPTPPPPGWPSWDAYNDWREDSGDPADKAAYGYDPSLIGGDDAPTETDPFFIWLAERGISRERYNRLPTRGKSNMRKKYQEYLDAQDTTDDASTENEYPWSNDPAFVEWFTSTYPGMYWDDLTEQQQYSHWDAYQASLTDGDDAPTETDPNEPRQVGDKWMDSAGNLWPSYEEAYASNVRLSQSEAERQQRIADFERRFSEYEDLMESGKAEDIALAERQTARMRGQLERRMESTIFGMGGEIPEGFEERLAETSTRQLLDIVSNIEQRYIAQQTAAKQFQIGTDITLDQLEAKEGGLEQQMFQFLQQQGQRQSMFESQMGFNQAELALRRELGLGQLGLGRNELALRRELGLGQLGLGQDELDLRRELGYAQIAAMPDQPDFWDYLGSGLGQGFGMFAGSRLGKLLGLG